MIKANSRNTAHWVSEGLELLGRIESAHKRAIACEALDPAQQALHVFDKVKACADLIAWVAAIAKEAK